MKKVLVLLCTILCANVLLAQTRFWIDSLQYEVTSTNPAKVEVYNANYSITNAIIPSTVTYQETTYDVTSIGYEAFRDRSSLTSITIPDSVTFIESRAFYGCSSLTSITIPNSVTSIGGAVFYNCSSLTSVTLSNNITELLDDVLYDYGFFENCNSLTSITIPNSVTSIGDYAFKNCSSLTSVTCLRLSAPSLGFNTFVGTPNYKILTIPCGANYSIWQNETTWESVDCFITIGSLFTIDDLRYQIIDTNEVIVYSCNTYATSVEIPLQVIYEGITYNVTSIDYKSFMNCSSLTSVTIPNSITSIGDYAFFNCSSLTSVNIPNSVTSIGYEAFRDCLALNIVTIGEGVTSISENCFRNCNVLMFVNLGSNVNFIRNGAFGNSQFLQNVTCLATTPPTISGNTAFPYPNTATLTVPCGTLEAYSAPTSLWNVLFADRIEEDCSGIEQTEAESISFFPNPTKSEITFSPAIEKVEVIDLTGKTIFTFSNAKTINIESLPAGVYYLRLTNNDKAVLRKLIKE